ncbi:alpha-crystallin A chain-like [Ptychodera flava]
MSGNEKKKNVPNQFKVDDFSTFSSSSLGQPQRSPFNQQRSPFDQNLRNGFTVWDFSPSASPSDPLGRHMSLSSEGSQLLRTPSVTSVSSSNQSENDDQYWEVLLDVSLYELDEIVVRGVENRVIVHAKHEERECGLDYVSREFSRQYVLPSNVEPETVTASLLPDGVLSLKAPK